MGVCRTGHNADDCKKYNSDVTPKKAFAGKNVQRNPCHGSMPCKQKTNYAQLSAKIVKPKKLTRNSKQEKSNDSDSS